MSVNGDKQPGLSTERTEPISTSNVEIQSSLPDSALDSQRFSPRSSNGVQHSVEFHIEELMLHGFAPPGDRYQIGEAIERELTRLCREHGSPIAATEDFEIADLSVGAISLMAGSNAEATGIKLARAIYGGLGK